MGCAAIGWPARSSAYRMNRTPFDGAPGTTAGSFASYWNVVAFHVYVVPNTTPGGKIEAATAPLDGTSAARSAVAASRLSASERARRVTSVGWAARSSGRRAAIGLAAVGTYVVANEKLWNGREVKLVPSAWTLAAVASGSAGFFGWSGLSPHAAGNGRGAVAALYQNRIPRPQRVGEPVELRERHGVAEQFVPRADHDFARLGTDRDHVHRLAEPAGEAATLPDGIAREARVLPHHVAAGRHQRPRRERRRVGRQMTLEHAHIVIIRDEADLHRLDLLGGHETEPPGDGSRLALGQIADGRQHPRHHAPVDAPEEVRLVFPGIAPAEQRAIARNRVMAGGHVRAVERVRVVQEVAELGERVAAHARDGRAAARVLGDEVGDHIATEAVFEIQDVVRDPELVRHEPGVGDRIEGAARTVGDGVAVAEQLHGGADHVVTLLDEERGGDGGIHPAGHGDRSEEHTSELQSPDHL